MQEKRPPIPTTSSIIPMNIATILTTVLAAGDVPISRISSWSEKSLLTNESRVTGCCFISHLCSTVLAAGTQIIRHIYNSMGEKNSHSQWQISPNRVRNTNPSLRNTLLKFR